MNILNNMNAKLAQNYKLTDMTCQICKGVTMGKIDLAEVYCPKCNKNYPIKRNQKQQQQSDDQYQKYYQEAQIQINQKKKQSQNKQTELLKQVHSHSMDQAESKYDEFLSYYTEMQKNKKSNSADVSKKIGAKLISGWKMLDEACLDCNVPLMESKKGQNKICCSCDKDFAKSIIKPQKKTQSPQNTKIPIKQAQPKVSNSDVGHHKAKQIPSINDTEQLDRRIKQKSYIFLEAKLDKAINENDIQLFEKIVDLIKKVKEI